MIWSYKAIDDYSETKYGWQGAVVSFNTKVKLCYICYHSVVVAVIAVVFLTLHATKGDDVIL